MVQYQRKGLYRGYPEGARNQWKLRTHHHLNITGIMNLLAERKIDYNKSSGKQRLLALVSRYECGLRSYERNNKRELRQICHARNLALETSPTANKANLIALLEAADDAVQFPGFLELPLELRLQVYTHHFDSFEQGSIIVAPPIAAVCRLVREEARPLFYGMHRFDLEANFSDPRVQRTIGGVFTYASIESEVDLGGEHTPGRVKTVTGRRMQLDLTAAEIGNANLRISRVLEDMSTRSKSKALRRGDISTLSDALLA
ncbi:hypothetical protein LTR97_007451 [Elasticomyces elasticus]|uniref:Uncharacterized protein n=1 Tax=Elasticomyces elasticus TaxID=574655 RepID=A0AAN8A249_9PEZI|nr:hypothetical protein LTR97_007451 [Elasticomyces elasticus]